MREWGCWLMVTIIIAEAVWMILLLPGLPSIFLNIAISQSVDDVAGAELADYLGVPRPRVLRQDPLGWVPNPVHLLV